MVDPIYRFVAVLVNLFASLQRGNLRQPPKLVPAHKKRFVRFRTTYAVLASNILLVLIPDVVASSLFLGPARHVPPRRSLLRVLDGLSRMAVLNTRTGCRRRDSNPGPSA